MNLKKKKKSPNDDLESAEWSVDYARGELKKLGEANLENVGEIFCFCHSLNQYTQSVILTYWRLGNKTKVLAAINELIEASSAAIRLIEDFRLKPLLNSSWPDFGRYALFSYLLNGSFHPDFLSYCKFSANDEIIAQKIYRIMDMKLALTMASGKKVRGYDTFFEEYFRKKRLGLVADTFLAYAAIVQAVTKGDREALPELIDACELNYLKRAADINFKYFGIEDGTARFNEQQIDFRLAALIKWAYRDHSKELKQIRTIHQWTFD